MLIFLEGDVCSERTFTLQVERTDSIATIRSHFLHEIYHQGVEFFSFKLFYNNKELKDGLTLVDYRIGNEGVINFKSISKTAEDEFIWGQIIRENDILQRKHAFFSRGRGIAFTLIVLSFVVIPGYFYVTFPVGVFCLLLAVYSFICVNKTFAIVRKSTLQKLFEMHDACGLFSILLYLVLLIYFAASGELTWFMALTFSISLLLWGFCFLNGKQLFKTLQFTKGDLTVPLLISSLPLQQCFVALRSSDVRKQREGAMELLVSAANEAEALRLVEEGAVLPLLAAAASPYSSTSSVALACLAELAVYAREEMLSFGETLHILVPLVSHLDSEVSLFALRTLAHLAVLEDGSKQLLETTLLKEMEKAVLSNDQRVRTCVATVIGHMALVAEFRQALYLGGALDILLDLLRNSAHRTTTVAALSSLAFFCYHQTVARALCLGPGLECVLSFLTHVSFHRAKTSSSSATPSTHSHTSNAHRTMRRRRKSEDLLPLAAGEEEGLLGGVVPGAGVGGEESEEGEGSEDVQEQIVLEAGRVLAIVSLLPANAPNLLTAPVLTGVTVLCESPRIECRRAGSACLANIVSHSGISARLPFQDDIQTLLTILASSRDAEVLENVAVLQNFL